MKCHCCKHLSSDGRAWQEYTEEGSERLPVGNKCADCAEVWVEAFSWMSWEDFCARLNGDAGFKSLVQGAMETKNGRGPVIPHEAASRIYGQYLEIRQGVEVLNEAELKKVLNERRLPKYMKSAAPTIQAPCPPARLEDIGGGDGTAEQEKLFCFRDPRQPHRTATLVTQVGWRSARQEMRTALWSNQGTAVVNANMLKQGQDSNWQVLDSRHDGQRMVALDDFVAERTGTVPEKQRAGTRKGVEQHSDDEDSEPDSGADDGRDPRGTEAATHSGEDAEDEDGSDGAPLLDVLKKRRAFSSKVMQQGPQAISKSPSRARTSADSKWGALSAAKSSVVSDSDDGEAGTYVNSTAQARTQADRIPSQRTSKQEHKQTGKHANKQAN